MIDDHTQGESKIRIITRRMFILSSLKLVVFFSLISRLFYLQVSENLKYRSLSDKNRLREWKISPKRGLILDFYGEKIADNTQVFQLHMVPEDVDNLDELFFRLSKLIILSDRKKRNLYKIIKKRKPWEPIIISDNLTWSEFSKLNLFLHEIQGIKPVIAVARKYPADGSFSHLVGYVSSLSQSDLEENEFLRKINIPSLKIGKTGLEKSLNEEIVGKAGYQRYEVNAFGKRVKELKFIKGTAGKDFKTTIDMEIQQFAGELLKNKTGSIKAAPPTLARPPHAQSQPPPIGRVVRPKEPHSSRNNRTRPAELWRTSTVPRQQPSTNSAIPSCRNSGSAEDLPRTWSTNPD